MTDDGQTGLAEFSSEGDDSSSSDSERDFAAEARAVAGDGDGSGIETIDPTRDGLTARYGEPAEMIRLSVMQIDYTVAGREPNERPIIHLYGRDNADEPHHVKVLGFEPYFYAPTESLDRPPEEEYDELVGSEETDGNGDPFESIRGEHLTKIYGRTPRDVGNVRDEFDHYEADILFPNRFLIDKDIQSGVEVPVRRDEEGSLIVAHEEVEAAEMTATPRVNTFDLEVDDRHGFPEPDDAEQPIICLASHDSYDDEYILWLYDAPVGGVDAPEALAGYDPLTDEADYEVRTFDSEEAMLEAFVDYLEETDPDIFTGWNCLPAESSILMGDGTEREIQNVEVGDTIAASDEQQPTTASVTNKWKSQKDVLEFQLADGTTLQSSEEHRIMVGDTDNVDWKTGGCVEAGDFVLKPRSAPIESESVPTLAELVPERCQRFNSETTIKEFKKELPYGAVSELANEFGVVKGTLYSTKPDTWTPQRCSLAADQYGIAMPDGGRTYRRSGADLNRELTEQELYQAGLVLTDGSMSESDGIRFYNTEKVLHEQFTDDPHLEPDGKGCYKQNVLDYARMHAFNGLGIPFGNKNSRTVDLHAIYEMPESYIGRFMAGVIDGDGCVSSSVTVSAVNESIGRWYVKLLRRLGIYAEQNGTTVRIPDAKRELTGLKTAVLPYMHHPKKRERLRSLEGGKSGRTENIPYALFEAETGTDAKRIGRDKHRREINLKRHETIGDQWSDYVFVEVEAVEPVGTKTTYDIETTTDNFIAEDCLVHNCDDFDIPYLINRLEDREKKLKRKSDRDEYDLSYNRLSRVGEVWAGGWGGPDIKGRVVFDLLYAYKRTQFTELESYRLDAVGEQELGVGKERYTGDIGDLWEDDPEQLLEYNLRDVELCVELDRKQNIVEFWDEVRTFVGCKLEDAPTPGDAVDMYVLHKVHGNFALPSKGKHEGEDYEGGAVFDPITGVKENVTVLDLKSLYPMCMVTTNASPETKVDPEKYGGETYRAPNGTHFRKEPDGIIREMVDELLTERENKKELRNEHDPNSEAYARYDQQQGAVKVIMNCFTPDTDVLTPRGVENIRDLDIGDEVYSIDPDTLEMERKPVAETHEYPEYHGELVNVETSKIDFSVTPNHRMLVRKNETNGITEDGYSFVEAGDLDDATNYELPHDWDGPDPEPIEEIDLTELIDGEYEVWVRPSVHGHTFTAELGWTPRRVPKADVGETGYVFTAEEFETHREYIENVCETSFIHRESGRKWIPRTYHADDFLELLAWYVTEGSVYTSEEKQFGEQFRGSATTISLAQDTPADDAVVTDGGSDHAAIGSLLDRLGFDYYVNEKGHQFTSKLLGNLLRELCGKDSFEKRIPDLVFDASRAQKESFLDTLIAGDGDRQPSSWRYSTASEQLRDDVLRLCTHLGLTASYNEEAGTWRIYVTENAKNTLRMHRSGSRTTADNGVYCVTVEDNNTLLAGRNGTFQFTGNSLYGVLGWDRFRLYDKEMGAAVTATGREVIEHTEDAANEAGHEVAYGDTDSVMLEVGHVQPDDVEADVVVTDSMRESHPEMSEEELESLAATIEKGYELEEQINGSYDEFALDQLNAEHHRFQIEFEKLYRRFFQAGKKKRYAGHIVWKEGKDVDDIDITGFEYQRSDIAQITKEVQLEVITRIVRGEDIEDVKTYVHDIIQEVQAGKVSLDEIGIPGGIGKKLDNYDTDTAQVRGAKYANELLGTNFSSGSKPKRLYLKKVHPDFFVRMEEEEGFDPQTDPLYGEFKRDPDVICFEYDDQIPEEFEVDYEKMLDKTLQGPIERVLEALDISWSEVKSGQEQTGLGGFM